MGRLYLKGLRIGLLLALVLVTKPICAQWCDSPGMGPQRTGSDGQGRAVVQIPVVVHVVYRTGAFTISDAQVASQIEVLNQDFRANNADLNQVTLPAFQQLIADTEIEFVLATSDPDGNPSNGIVRRPTSTVDIASTFDSFGRRQIAYTELGGSDAWNTDCYLNIWVGEFNEGVAGLGTFPGSVDPLEDGVYIAYDRFGTTGTATAPYNKGRTTTHEIGHFLGLQHLWGNEAFPPADCSGDDGIADTNPQSNSYLGECPMGNRLSCGSFDMYMNFMSLADDACLLMFTQGQKQLMRSVLLQTRSMLIDENCTVSTIAPAILPQTLLTAYSLQAHVLQGRLRNTQPVELRLYNLAGRLLLRLPQQRHTFQIDMQYFPEGIYILQAQNRRIHQSVKVLYTK